MRTLWVSQAIFYIYYKWLKDVHQSSASQLPKLFVTEDRSTLDKFTAAREYNSISMGRIDHPHAQKASGVTTSRHGVEEGGAQ